MSKNVIYITRDLPTVVTNRDLSSSSMYLHWILKSQLSYFWFLIYLKSKNCIHIMYLFSADVRIFKMIFCPWKHTKPASNVAHLCQFGFFSLCLTDHNGPRLEIYIGNVSQDTSVLQSVDKLLNLKTYTCVFTFFFS